MKYLVVSEADRPIKCQCNGELYLALAMENLSLTDGYQVQPVPWRQSERAESRSDALTGGDRWCAREPCQPSKIPADPGAPLVSEEPVMLRPKPETRPYGRGVPPLRKCFCAHRCGPARFGPRLAGDTRKAAWALFRGRQALGTFLGFFPLQAAEFALNVE